MPSELRLYFRSDFELSLFHFDNDVSLSVETTDIIIASFHYEESDFTQKLFAKQKYC